jgi:hypothetical protein
MRKSTVHAMFVWQGFITNGGDHLEWNDEDSDRYEGEIGAALWVAEIVDILAEALDGFWSTNPEVSFPGVFDYEVSEALGTWLRREPPCADDTRKVRLKVRSLIESFFFGSKGEASNEQSPEERAAASPYLRQDSLNPSTTKGNHDAQRSRIDTSGHRPDLDR